MKDLFETKVSPLWVVPVTLVLLTFHFVPMSEATSTTATLLICGGVIWSLLRKRD
jgi:hypothetical protein